MNLCATFIDFLVLRTQKQNFSPNAFFYLVMCTLPLLPVRTPM